MVILFRLAMIAYHLHTLCHLLIVGGDGSRLATRTEILARIKTERGCVTHRAGLSPSSILLRKVFSPVCLAGIFNDNQVVLLSKVEDRVHLRRLSVKVYWNNG